MSKKISSNDITNEVTSGSYVETGGGHVENDIFVWKNDRFFHRKPNAKKTIENIFQTFGAHTLTI
jgi:hypothetical protein